MALRIGLVLGAVLVIALVISTRDLPDDVAGRPEISVAFPEASESGSIQDATFTVVNPGPGRMDSIFITFARVGPGSNGGGLPVPIVDGGAQHENPAIVSIDPEPVAVSLEAVAFRFEGLDEGDELVVTFALRVPNDPGPAANSVTAYPGEDPQRAKGVRLETEVGG